MIRHGDLVTFHFTMSNPEGLVIDTSGEAPVEHICGAHTVVPGLERALMGRSVGETFDITVAASEAYGVPVTEDALVQLPVEELPPGMPRELGMIVMLEDDAGEPMPMWLVAMTDTHALFDCNHPLAGVTLHYQVTIVDARAATATEKRRELMGAGAGL